MGNIGQVYFKYQKEKFVKKELAAIHGKRDNLKEFALSFMMIVLVGLSVAQTLLLFEFMKSFEDRGFHGLVILSSFICFTLINMKAGITVIDRYETGKEKRYEKAFEETPNEVVINTSSENDRKKFNLNFEDQVLYVNGFNFKETQSLMTVCKITEDESCVLVKGKDGSFKEVKTSYFFSNFEPV